MRFADLGPACKATGSSTRPFIGLNRAASMSISSSAGEPARLIHDVSARTSVIGIRESGHHRLAINARRQKMSTRSMIEKKQFRVDHGRRLRPPLSASSRKGGDGEEFMIDESKAAAQQSARSVPEVRAQMIVTSCCCRCAFISVRCGRLSVSTAQRRRSIGVEPDWGRSPRSREEFHQSSGLSRML